MLTKPSPLCCHCNGGRGKEERKIYALSCQLSALAVSDLGDCTIRAAFSWSVTCALVLTVNKKCISIHEHSSKSLANFQTSEKTRVSCWSLSPLAHPRFSVCCKYPVSQLSGATVLWAPFDCYCMPIYMVAISYVLALSVVSTLFETVYILAGNIGIFYGHFREVITHPPNIFFSP